MGSSGSVADTREIQGLLDRLDAADPARREAVIEVAPGPWRKCLHRLCAGPDPDRALRLASRLPAAVVGAGPLPHSLTELLHQGSYPSRLLALDPTSLETLARPETGPPLEGATLVAELLGRMSDEGPADALGRIRTREFLRLARMEVEGAPLERVGGDLSVLAGAMVEAALRDLDARLARDVVVFGMGKLGGSELNFLSDIDLIFVHDDRIVPGDADLAHEIVAKLHARLRDLVRLLEGGGEWRPLFRVDLRLRPFGSRGPLSLSLSATESYYERHGRPWERQMWVRGRPIAGNLELGEELLRRLTPFVYRRSVSSAIFEEISELMLRARREARETIAGGEAIDLKLDAGGIREIEFTAQALQLLSGGRNPAVRAAGTLAGLDRLLAAGLISDREHEHLSDAYRFLRRVEQAAASEEMGPLSLDEFDRTLREHRLRVAAIAQTLHGPSDDEKISESDAARRGARDAVLDPGAPAHVRIDALARMGLRDPEEAHALLVHLHSRRDGVLTAGGAARAGAERLLLACLDSADPDAALRRFVEFAAPRPAHYAVWRFMAGPGPEGLDLVRLAAELFGASEPLSRGLIGFPVEHGAPHDESVGLLLAANDPDLPDAARLTREYERFPRDPRGLDATLLRFKHQELVRIGLCDLGRRPDALAVGAALSDLADVVVRALLDDLAREHSDGERDDAAFVLSVLGLGKYGMQAMDYGSDLDLMLVFSPLREDDDATLDLKRQAVSIGQRLLARLQDRSHGARLYEVDMRLRPSGRQGLLVSSLESFRRYHTSALPVWERIAMLRVRPVAEACFARDAREPTQSRQSRLGHVVTDEILAPAVVRQDADTALPRDVVVREVRRLRDRIQKELARETRDDLGAAGNGKYDVKSGVGGCIELELLVSALQLLHAPAHPRVGVRGIVEAITSLGNAGILSRDEVSALSAAYRFHRLLLNRLRMSRATTVEDPDRFSANSPNLAALARRMGLSDRDILVRSYLETRETVRSAFDRHLS
jgi:glutamate-ammonia-ligase adenylyltransferase